MTINKGDIPLEGMYMDSTSVFIHLNMLSLELLAPGLCDSECPAVGSAEPQGLLWVCFSLSRVLLLPMGLIAGNEAALADRCPTSPGSLFLTAGVSGFLKGVFVAGKLNALESV